MLDRVNASNNIFIGLTIGGVQNLSVNRSCFNGNIGVNFPGLGGDAVWGVLAVPSGFGDVGGGGFIPNSNLCFKKCHADNNRSLGGTVGVEILSIPGFGLPYNTNVHFSDSLQITTSVEGITLHFK